MPSLCELPVPRKLRWKMSEKTLSWIEKAKKRFDEYSFKFNICSRVNRYKEYIFLLLFI